MNPSNRAALIAAGFLLGMILVPAALILLRDFLNIIAIAVIYSVFIYISVYYLYTAIHDELTERIAADEKVIQGFQNDPMKIHFYRAFKKYFDGDIMSKEGLQHWLEQHRPPY